MGFKGAVDIFQSLRFLDSGTKLVLSQVELAIQQPGDNSPVGAEDDAKENLTGFERASQEIEKASQIPSPRTERAALTEVQPEHAAAAAGKGALQTVIRTLKTGLQINI